MATEERRAKPVGAGGAEEQRMGAGARESSRRADALVGIGLSAVAAGRLATVAGQIMSGQTARYSSEGSTRNTEARKRVKDVSWASKDPRATATRNPIEWIDMEGARRREGAVESQESD